MEKKQTNKQTTMTTKTTRTNENETLKTVDKGIS